MRHDEMSSMVKPQEVRQYWDLSSGDNHLDIDEEDGYVLSANGK